MKEFVEKNKMILLVAVFLIIYGLIINIPLLAVSAEHRVLIGLMDEKMSKITQDIKEIEDRIPTPIPTPTPTPKPEKGQK